MWQVYWTVKATKFCNLRCAYCYEWNELSRRERIAPAQWGKIFVAARRYHALQSERLGETGRTCIVWHGGEPLLLPVAYFEDVLARERAVFGAAALASGEVRNRLQSNLVAASDEKLDLLSDHRFGLGVSLDWVPGVRLDLHGRETETQVLRNLKRVRDRGIPLTVATVLAGHTLAHLRRIHDQCAELEVPLHLLPMFDPPQSAPQIGPSSDRAIVAALTDLYDHWVETGCAIRVEPLSSCLTTVLQRLCGLERPAYDRSVAGEQLLTVNTNGDLYTPRERYRDDLALGNVFRQTIEEILESPAYAASLARDSELADRHCGNCRYSGACDRHPVLARPHSWPAGPCPIVSRVCDYIEQRLAGEEVDASTLRDWLPLRAMTSGSLNRSLRLRQEGDDGQSEDSFHRGDTRVQLSDERVAHGRAAVAATC
jgi:uncharacterized protein